jgi:hypothetical protein
MCSFIVAGTKKIVIGHYNALHMKKLLKELLSKYVCVFSFRMFDFILLYSH